MKKYLLIILGIISALIITIAVFLGNNNNSNSTTNIIVDSSKTSYIKLNETSISEENSNAKINKQTITITSGGTYEISGTLKDGQVIVDTKESVTIILNDVDITCSNSSPIYIKNGTVILTLADNTTNKLTDGSKYSLNSDKEPEGTLYSKDDLTINGNGYLVVSANYADGIVSKDNLTIESGNITINSVDDAIRGTDSVTIKNGTFVINSGGDAIKSSNDTDDTKGLINIVNGTFSITSGQDGIQASTNLQIDNGEFTIQTGGGSSKALTNSDDSYKGLKADNVLTINGGTFNIDSKDDSIHSNNEVIINNGGFTISSGDDGMYSDTKLTINNGSINIKKSYEGIESTDIIVKDGNISVTSSDDGFNISGGNDASGTAQNRMGGMDVVEDGNLVINGGYIYVNATGDGLDSNGGIIMTSGTVIVNGPTANDNGALDYNGTFNISGGTIIAAGSSGMAQAPSTTSKQYSVLVNFTSSYSANTIINIQDSSGNSVLTFAPTKTFASIAFSSSLLKKNETYTVYVGGSSTGSVKDGLYSGTYTAGTKYTSFTISSITTTLGSTGMRR